MGRFNNSGYGHYCDYVKTSWGDYYEIGWTFDRYYDNSRLRFPKTMRRDTDEAGARRFCKKWGLEFTEQTEGAQE